jgi:hypothetical protein
MKPDTTIKDSVADVESDTHIRHVEDVTFRAGYHIESELTTSNFQDARQGCISWLVLIVCGCNVQDALRELSSGNTRRLRPFRISIRSFEWDTKTRY